MIHADDIRHRDAIVIGSGVAGLTAALSLGSATVITKGTLGWSGSTPWSQGGIAAPLGADDSPALHARDTVAVSGGIGEQAVAALLTARAASRIQWLQDIGAHFDRAADGSIALGREAGHSRHRIVHAGGDATGAEVARALSAATRAHAGIELVEHAFAVDLLQSGSRIVGVLVIHHGRTMAYVAPAVILATGGIGRVYARTTNSPEVTGDGLAMAARAGAALADVEFVQFHPTALAAALDPMPLLTEALRGAGATLVDRHGRRFMPDVHPSAELAPRDIVARAVFSRTVAGEPVFLDATRAVGAAFPERFPTVFDAATNAGLDPRTQPLPVSPAAHYHMGGVAVDSMGRTSLEGLWAVGEAASTGVHGANRLASNSLLEGLVFGATVADCGARVADPDDARRSRRARAAGRPVCDARRRARAGDSRHDVEARRRSARCRGPHARARALRRARRARQWPRERTQHARSGTHRRAGGAGPHREPRGAFPIRPPATRSVAGAPHVRHAGTAASRRAGGAPRRHGSRVAVTAPLPASLVTEAVARALAEDLGRAGDITSAATIPAEAIARAVIVARAPGVVAGLPLVVESFRQVDERVHLTLLVEDGTLVERDTVLARLDGPARSILTAERTALNFLGHLGGIATATHSLVDAVAGTRARIADTRKTTPGLRALEKYAVRCGGGTNHRFGLDDAVLIKDNHIAAAGGVGEAVRAARAHASHVVTIEVEVETLAQLDEAIGAGAHVVLLDNMTPAELAVAVQRIGGRAIAEASGGITLASVRAMADAGVDLISSGWITHSAPRLDVALDVVA